MPLSTTSQVPLASSHMSDRHKYMVGVCAMDRKARSKPMTRILDRMVSTGTFDIVIFGDKTIIEQDIDQWPSCDFLICFYSTGFPLQKALEYVKRYKPFVANDVAMQSILWDRRAVLSILDSVGVPTPPRLIVSRDGGVHVNADAAKAFYAHNGRDLDKVLAKYSHNTKQFVVTEDGINVDGISMFKTLIEKPANGEDHNINIYYSNEHGGGGRRLFRKVGDKSSMFDPHLTSPSSEGSWVYEKLMEAENCEDIKVYTVGPNYIHAETRKSPTVDGHVRRNQDGKEIRYTAQLTPEEEDIARKVSGAFGQLVCGFDLLRVHGNSYVIDVNGWSFVKGNEEYYETCARILTESFLQSIQQRRSSTDSESCRSKTSLKLHSTNIPSEYVSVYFPT